MTRISLMLAAMPLAGMAGPSFAKPTHTYKGTVTLVKKSDARHKSPSAGGTALGGTGGPLALKPPKKKASGGTHTETGSLSTY